MNLSDYRNYLNVLGYSRSAQVNYPRQVGEYLEYARRAVLSEADYFSSVTLENYFAWLSGRENKKKQGALSGVYLNSHRSSLVNYFKYLSRQQGIPIPTIKSLNVEPLQLPLVLTREEVAKLYEATQAENHVPTKLRDRVLLDLCYGAGLRKSEATSVTLTHLHYKEKLLHVPKGKGSKQRYVPLTKSIIQHIEEYLKESRPYYQRADSPESLLLNQRGQALQSYYHRLKELSKVAALGKTITPHTLRHSIATHLMEGGMELEEIAKFLGHSSLESTQLYTHIVHH